MMPNPGARYKTILSKIIGEARLLSYRLIASGHSNEAILLETEGKSYFLKTNTEPAADIFEKEADGLDYLRHHTFLHVPQIYGLGKLDELNFLLMEWVSEGSMAGDFWEKLARGLAQLHRNTAPQFGFKEDNYIAVLPQVNGFRDNWAAFFVENRIEKMLSLASGNGLIADDLVIKCRKIYPRITAIFPNEKPALLHGDLWSGNILANGKGEPCIIDPAVYFGLREMELAFTRLFGGFNEQFYAVYEEIFPIEPGFKDREDIYNLYPLLVHLNLFGKSYLPAIKATIDRFAD